MKKIFFILLSILILASCTSKREKAIVLNKSGIHKMNDNHIKEALADFDKAVQTDPTFDQAYYYRGNMKFSLTDYQGALADYTKAIELNPGFMDAYCNRAQVYQSIDQLDKACPDWKKAKELGRPNLEDKLSHCN